MKMMRQIPLLFLAMIMASCSLFNLSKKIEHGIGVRNEGIKDTRAICLFMDQGELSFGGVSPKTHKLMMRDLYINADYDYPPIKIQYGLLEDLDAIETYSIDWVKPPQDVLTGPYPPKLMITIYPGIKGKEPRMEWKRLDQITL